MTDNINKKIIFKKIACIYYPLQFHKNKTQALIYIKNKINAINSNYTLKLGFKVAKTSIKA